MAEPKPRLKFSDRPRRERLAFLLSGPVAIILIGAVFYLMGDRYVETDNAYVKANKVSISAEIAGRIAQVNIKDNVHVEQGQVLFTLDCASFEIALHQAEGNLANTRADIESLRADYLQKQAELTQVESNVQLQNKDYERYAQIMKSGAATVQRFDQARYARDAAIASVSAAKQAISSALAKLGGDPNTPIEEHPRFKQAQAALDKAKLDLERTEIKAPSSGIVANVTARPGEYVLTGLPLFSLVDDQHIWVEANFKETDLTHVRAGQWVHITIDTFPGHEWLARVASISPASGAEFSILPPQNSSGNWVKVVQRIMVRLEFEPRKNEQLPQLSSGMSADVSIDTRYSRFMRFLGFGE
jgi:membrane fusion protein (multidrug efflux system)